MYKHKLFLLPVAWLLTFMAFACAPPDDDAPSSAPAITSASYDFATALLTVQGTDLSPTSATQAQIQTIVVDGVAFSSYTADDPATGPDSRDLAKGKYRIATDGTKLWLKLTEQHKAALEAKVGSNGLKKGLLTSSGAWAGLDTAKDLTVSNIPDKQTETEEESPKQTEDEQVEQAEEESPKQPKDKQVEQAEEESPKQTEDEQVEQAEEESPKQPKDKQVEQAEEESPKQTEDEQVEQAEEESPKQPKDEQVEQAEEESPKAAITRATYNVGTALLTVQGTHLASATQAQIQTIVVDGLALNYYTADATATGSDSRGLAKGKYRLHSAGTALWLYLTDTDKATLNGKTGMDSNGLKDGLLTSTGTWAGLDTAKGLAVSGNPAPTITSATYDAITGRLVITGVNLPSSVRGWDFSKLRLVAGNGRKSARLSPHNPTDRNRAKGSAASATSLTITLKGTEYTKAYDILVTNGDSDDAGAYNLEAAAGFAGGRAEDTTNPITVSGYVSQIKHSTYNPRTGVLVINGRKLPTAVADWDFSKLTLVSSDGKKKYTLPRHAIGENTATGSASTTSLTITLSGSVKAEADKILVKVGLHNLEAAAGFVMGSPADTKNIILS